MHRSSALKLTVTTLLMVVVLSLAIASVSSASYQLPVNDGAFSVARDWMPYVVQSGESLVAIAERFNVPAPVLAHTNGISDFDSLSAGQVVWIPTFAAEVVNVAPSYVKATSETVLYAGPSARFSIAAKMRAGEAAIVTGRSADGEWLRVGSVSNNNSRGWIKTDSELFRMFALPVAPR